MEALRKKKPNSVPEISKMRIELVKRSTATPNSVFFREAATPILMEAETRIPKYTTWSFAKTCIRVCANRLFLELTHKRDQIYLQENEIQFK